MPSEQHAALVKLGARWFKRNGFGVVATELSVVGCAEQADVVAFRSACSGVIEAKVSRSDFLADRRKPHRRDGGLGNYRFYICPEGLIDAAELPPRWGLLWALDSNRRIVEVVRPVGNLWPDEHSLAIVGRNWEAFWNPSSPTAERSVLYSIARRRGGS